MNNMKRDDVIMMIKFQVDEDKLVHNSLQYMIS